MMSTNKMNWFLPLQEAVLIDKDIFEMDENYEIHIDTGETNDLRYGTIPGIAISRVESKDEQFVFRLEFYTNKLIEGQYKRVLIHYNEHKDAKTLIADVEDYIQAKQYAPKKIFCAMAEMFTCNLLISSIEDVRQNLLLRMVFPTSKHSKEERFPTTLEPGLAVPLSYNGFYVRSDFIKVVKPNKEYIELTSTKIRDFVLRESSARIDPKKIPSRLHPPRDVLFTVLKTIETWCKEEAEQWKFPSTIIFYYTWRGWPYDAIHATREINEGFIGYSIRIAKRDMRDQVLYFDTYDGIIVGNDLVRSEVDTTVWNRNKQTEEYRRALIRSLQYTSTVPKSLHGVCNTQTVLQRYNECWYIAAVVLASKTIYELVMENTKKFLQTYRQYTQPISAKGSALLMPEEIALCYRNKFTKNSVFISHFLDDGGFELQLFEAILDINMIPYHSFKYVIHGLPEKIEYIRFPKESSYLLLTYSIDSQRPVAVRGHTWDEFIRRIIDTYKRHDHAVLGGMISMNEGKPDTSHAISFTVCADRTIICNYGKCFETITDTSNLDMDLLEDITFLIEKRTKKKNTLEMEASKLENNFNHVHLSLVHGNLTLTIRITNVRQDNIEREQNPKGKINPSIEGKLIKIDNPWHSDDYGLRLGQKLIFSSKNRYYFLTSMPGDSIPEKWSGQPFFANQDFNFTLRLYNARKRIDKEGRKVMSLDNESEAINVDSENGVIIVD